MKKQYYGIQMLRGVLFLCILAFHCNVPYAEFGWGGVEAFFVISAFFFVKKFWNVNSNIKVANQIKHRVLRLYPTYLAVLLIAIAYSILKKMLPYDLIIHLFSGQNFLWMITKYHSPMQPITAHTWTLSIEVWLGIIWLILLKCLDKKGFKKTMYALIGVAIIYRSLIIIIGANIYYLSLNPISHMDAFALGSLLAISNSEEENRLMKWPVLCIGVVGIIGSITLLSFENRLPLSDGYKLLGTPRYYLTNLVSGNIYLFIQMVTVGLLAVLVLNENIQNTGIKKIVTALGDSSYALYLFHWPVLVVVSKIKAVWYFTFPVVLVISIMAVIIFNVIERKIKEIIYRRKIT